MINEFQKYPENKRQYDRNYIRAHGGKKCKKCKGTGLIESRDYITNAPDADECPNCDGLGYVEKPKRSKHLKMRREHFEGKADYS